MANHEFDVRMRCNELLDIRDDENFCTRSLMLILAREVRAVAVAACSRNGCHECGGAIERAINLGDKR